VLGNTGAIILASSRSFGKLPGVRRVGLAAVYPTATRRGPHDDPFALMLDVGATLNCTAEDLVAFAVMGHRKRHGDLLGRVAVRWAMTARPCHSSCHRAETSCAA